MNPMKATYIPSFILCCLGILDSGAQDRVTIVGDITISPQTLVSVYSDLYNTETGILANDGELHLHRNLVNDGLMTYANGSSGLTAFIGDVPQRVEGNMPIDLRNVRFDNGSAQPAFALDNEMNISARTTFQQGIVDAAPYGGIVRFIEGATHDLESDTSHVDGVTDKVGNTAFVFPVGDAQHYRMAMISAPEKNNDGFSARYFFEDATTRFPAVQKVAELEVIDNAEYWDIQRTSGNSTVYLSLGWDLITTPAQLLSGSLDELTIAYWDADAQQWTDANGTIDLNTQTLTTANTLTKFGIYTLAKRKARPEDLHLAVHDIMTPDMDGRNDYLKIDRIEDYPMNHLELFNRWGILVYRADSYGQNGELFTGFSQGRATLSTKDQLPTGTYYYILRFTDEKGIEHHQAGPIYLNR